MWIHHKPVGAISRFEAHHKPVCLMRYVTSLSNIPASRLHAASGEASSTQDLTKTTNTPKASSSKPQANGNAPEPVNLKEEKQEQEQEEITEQKSDEYTETMNRRMGTSLTYRHELGIDYNRILPDLIVGSCLQTPEDVDRLAEEEGVTTVFCLQEDCDMEYFNLDIKAIQDRCEERSDIKHVRFPIRDFDPYDLRRKLPKAVSRLAREHSPEPGNTIYIHCTAGMGRAPAVALAYMNWIRGMPLDETFAMLKSMRQCGPKIEAIRSATSDLLLGTEAIMTTIAVHRWGSATRIQVAGLDMGWHAPVDMERDPVTKRFVLNRKLYPGKYMYKLIVDGVWTFSADHPTAMDGNNVNNTLEVIPAAMDDVTRMKQVRYLSEGTILTAEEQEELQQMLCPWHNTDSDGCIPSARDIDMDIETADV